MIPDRTQNEAQPPQLSLLISERRCLIAFSQRCKSDSMRRRS